MTNNIPSIEGLLTEAKQTYRNEFGADPEIAVCAPGRVNLIGEHTDYNDGFVLPMALPLVTVIVGSEIDGDESTILTTKKEFNENRKVTFEMPRKRALICVCKPGTPKWANYVKGVVVNYITDAPAFQAVVASSVPVGGGLSSSASLEVATYTFLEALTGNKSVSANDKALACQKAEHDFAGMPCGIMDQFISVMGKPGNALLIDCRLLTSTLIPFSEENIVILITNSNVKHELTGSEYSTRRKQCQQASLLIKKLSLRDATNEDLEYLISINTDEDIIKRARHVVGEIRRTLQAAEALKERNFQKVGKLMIESHNSLRDDFEVSCSELDQLVELAMECEGVLGTRMTGGGFGGCTVTMVFNHAVDRVVSHIKSNYKGTPTFYVCKPSDGAGIL